MGGQGMTAKEHGDAQALPRVSMKQWFNCFRMAWVFVLGRHVCRDGAGLLRVHRRRIAECDNEGESVGVVALHRYRF